MAMLGLVFMYHRLHRVAMLVLAIGFGVQAARMIAANPDGFRRFTRRTTGWMAVLVVAIGVGVTGSMWWKERRLISALPSAQDGAPNVLLIILDTVRAASLGLYGYDRPTSPALDRFAMRGIIFDNAIATAPWTLPSHGSMFTGRFPHEMSADWQVPLDETYPTLAEVLAERGYLTAGFVANTFYGSYEHGLDRGFAHYEDYTVGLGQMLNSSSLGFLIFAGRPGFSANFFRGIIGNFEFLGRKKADDITGDVLSWLDENEDRPFFAFVNYFDAHWPYTPPAEFRRQFGVTERPLGLGRNARRRTGIDEAELRREDKPSSYDKNAYDAAIASQDRELGELFDELERRRFLDNTLVIITSDHGEQLGEHGLFAHGNSLYMPLIHVPLVISFPGRVPEGRRVARFATLRSLPATVLDLVRARDEQRIPGTSLAAMWSDPAARGDPLLSEVRKGINTARHVPVTKGDMKSLIESAHHYIRNGDGREELYDLTTDPAELTDLAPAEQARPALLRSRTMVQELTQPRSASGGRGGEAEPVLGARGAP